MTQFLEYHDIHAIVSLRKSKLPFTISINTIDSYVKLHHHDFVELSFVIEGRGTETINEEEHIMQPGTASFLLPHHIHRIDSSTRAPIRLYCCMFDINLLYGSPFDLELVYHLLRSGKDFPSYIDFNPEQTEHLKRIFADLLHEYNNSDFGRFGFIRAKLIEALFIFSRAQRTIKSNKSTDQSHDPKRKIWDIILYLHLHYPEKITLEDLSLRFKVSPSHISHSFKKHCGKSFLEYLHTLRINYALSLLSTTDMSVTDISVETGFDSFRSFSRVFKRFQGMTSSEFRESKLKNTDMPG